MTDTAKLIAQARRDAVFYDWKLVFALADTLEAAERRLAVLGQERDAIAEALNAAEAQRDTLAAALRRIANEGHANPPAEIAEVARAALAAVEPTEGQP